MIAQNGQPGNGPSNGRPLLPPSQVPTFLRERRRESNPFRPARVQITRERGAVQIHVGSARINGAGWVDVYSDLAVRELEIELATKKRELREAQAEPNSGRYLPLSVLQAQAHSIRAALDAEQEVTYHSFPPHLVQGVAWVREETEYENPFADGDGAEDR